MFDEHIMACWGVVCEDNSHFFLLGYADVGQTACP
nr:MAG TPA_asm: hypothetical protein [Caudoviricetes sp.]